MKKLFIPLLLLVFTKSISAETVKCTFNVGSGSNKELILRVFKNSITRDVWSYTCRLDSLGRGTLVFDLDRPRPAYINTPSCNLMLFLSPSNNLNINFAYNNPQASLNFVGSSVDDNSFIAALNNDHSDPSCGRDLYKSGVTNDQYKTEIFRRWKERKDFYNIYKQSHRFSSKFDYYAQGLVDYRPLRDLLLLDDYLERLGKQKMQNKDQFYAFLTPDTFDKDSLVKYSLDYQSAASCYTWVLPQTIKYVSNLSKEYQDYRAAHKGKTGDYLTASYLFALYGTYALFENDYKDFKATCTDQEVLEILRDAFITLNIKDIPKEVMATVFLATDGKEVTLKQIIGQNAGKVLYLDVWITTCWACINELPPLDRLAKKMKAMPFEVISLCVENNTQNWKDFLLKRAMAPKNQFLIKENMQSELCKNYIVNAFPRFMLIDSNGRMANSNAPRPLEPLLPLELKKLISSAK